MARLNRSPKADKVDEPTPFEATTPIAATTPPQSPTEANDEVSLKPLAEWQPGSGDGLLLDVVDEPEQRFAVAPLIAINFPAFTDGRGLSLAVLLRTRFDFQGELRAVGAVQPDIIHYMKRCGFDSFQLPEGQPVAIEPVAADQTAMDVTLAPYSDYYQASVHQPEPAYRRIRRGG
jgi:uncharacterized protein (DUF934 family)